ncbi:MAG: beta-ketoacyl synthase chain length factor [Deltaproteobacteria bacterium]|nr:beta-ketoacyl synthase chain length factor [Deltaproteobacteria bacterium]
MDKSILGIGTVSAMGCGIESLRQGLSGNAFPNILAHHIETKEGTFTLPVYRAVAEGLENYIERSRLRRMDPFLRMGLLASCLAMQDSGLEIDDGERVGIVFGTGYGALASSFGSFNSLMEDGDNCVSPTLFATSVHNAMASNVSIALGLGGPLQTVSSFEMTTWAVFDLACGWIDEGIVDYVLTGVGDEYCPTRGYSVLLSGARGMTAMNPLDFSCCTYLPGEGFSAFLIGKGQGYCRISATERVAASHFSGKGMDALFLSANGEKEMAAAYSRCMKESSRIAAYAPLYGGLPVGQGFDLAVAALSLKEGTLYPSPSVFPAVADKRVICKKEKFGNPFTIGTVQCDRDGNGGVVELSSP